MAGERSVRARVCAGAWHHDVDVVLLAAARGPSRTFGASATPPAARALGAGARHAGRREPRQRSGDVLASGDRVRVSDQVSVETLRGVVQVLRTAC